MYYTLKLQKKIKYLNEYLIGTYRDKQNNWGENMLMKTMLPIFTCKFIVDFIVTNITGTFLVLYIYTVIKK